VERVRATAPAGGANAPEQEPAQAQAAALRKVRTAERRHSDRVADKEREAQRAAEKVKQAQVAIEEKARKDAELVLQAEADAALKRDQKAARDAKYAARKARQR
jgi:hypothetical protein